MKIQFKREPFFHAFQSVAGVAPTRSPKTILQNVRLDVVENRATLMATDLEIGIRHEFEDVEVEQPGSAILNVSKFGSILREGTDEVLSMELDGPNLSIRGERSRFRLTSADPHEFPAVAEFGESAVLEISSKLLGEVIRRTIFATDVESSRYALGGTLLEMQAEQLVAVSTDGRRLAKMEGPVTTSGDFQPPDGNVIVPMRVLQLVEKSLAGQEGTVRIALQDNAIVMGSERVTIHAQLLQGRFPPWREVIPARSVGTDVELVVGPLHSAVRQAAIVTSDENRGIEFEFGEGNLALSSRSPEFGESKVDLPIAYSGDTVEVKLDPGYVTDFLRVLDAEDTVTFQLQGNEQAVVAHSGEQYAYVIMPLAQRKKS